LVASFLMHGGSFGFDLSGLASGAVRSLEKLSAAQGVRSVANADWVEIPDLPTGHRFEGCESLFVRSRPILASDVDRKWNAKELCFSHFAVLYSQASKTPLMVFERLNAQQIKDAAGEQRTNAFFADPRIREGLRAELEDYKGSGWQRGHMSPAADQPDAVGMAQSFSLANIVPQNGINNEKTWAKIESDVRKFARRAKGNVYVITGPLFDGEPRKIGRNKVWVPTRLFKLVLDESSGRSWAYIVGNNESDVAKKPIGYSEFVAETGLDVLNK